MDMARFVAERNEALLSLDKKKIDAYLEKYGCNVPEDELVYWAGVHKAICNITNAPEEAKQNSRHWLESRGFKTTIF